MIVNKKQKKRRLKRRRFIKYECGDWIGNVGIGVAMHKKAAFCRVCNEWSTDVSKFVEEHENCKGEK